MFRMVIQCQDISVLNLNIVTLYIEPQYLVLSMTSASLDNILAATLHRLDYLVKFYDSNPVEGSDRFRREQPFLVVFSL